MPVTEGELAYIAAGNSKKDTAKVNNSSQDGEPGEPSDHAESFNRGRSLSEY
jgi:hypothetical protein